MLAVVGSSMKDVKVSPERRAALTAELRKNDPGFLRRAIRSYFEYLDRQGSLAKRLCESGGATWVVFGDHGDVGLRDDERAVLDACHNVALQVVPDAGHLTLNEQPARVARIVLDAVSSLAT